LKEHPEYQKKFSTFANVPMSELMKNGHFLAQAYTIMAGLNVVIQSSGSQELISQEVSHLGIAHFERGVSIPMFEVILLNSIISSSFLNTIYILSAAIRPCYCRCLGGGNQA